MAGRGKGSSHGAGYQARPLGTREQRKRFLIVCEGYNYCDTACARSEFSDPLSDQLRFRYAKNHPDMYSVLMPLQETAIRNAERLLAQYDPPDPANDNPSTTVHLLVKALRASSRP